MMPQGNACSRPARESRPPTRECRLRRLRRYALFCLLAPLLVLAGATPKAWAQSGGRIMLVLDSSLAMQGALGNETKMEAAKNALGAVLPHYEGRLDLGLSAYGSRKAKACADVQLLSPPVPFKSARLARQVQGLQPAGSAALAQALTDAAVALGPAGETDRVVLVTGGPDACAMDPCEAARQAKAQTQTRIDVIAIRGASDDVKALRCITKVSGGTFMEVGNAAKLVAALEAVLGKAAPQAAAAETPSATDAETEGGAGDIAASSYTEGVAGGEDALDGGQSRQLTAPLSADDPLNQPTGDGKIPTVFSALLADPGPQIDSGLTWRIYDRKPGSDGLHKLIARSDDAAPRMPLAPGDYLVNVAYGRAYLTRGVKVVEGRPARELFILNAGGLRLNAVTAGGQPIAAGALINDIYSDERDQSNNRALIVSGVKAGTILRLNAGIYHVKSTYGDANGTVQGDITIEAGQLTDLTITHLAATVTLKLVGQSGGEALADTQWRIFTPDGVLVRESVGALPTHILAPGRYTVEATRGGQKYAQAFEVEAGQARTVEVVLPE